MDDNENEFLASFWTKFGTIMLSNVDNIHGALGTSFSSVIGATNIFLGTTPIGKFIQLGRSAEATAVSFAAGATNPNVGGLVNAAASLAVTAALVYTAPLTLPAAAVALVASAVAGAAAQALYETLVEFYPGLFEGIYDDLSGAIGGIYEHIFDFLIVPFPMPGFLFQSPLLNIFHDPLILDLNGDGIQLSPLDGSTVHFDYDGDGFAERTGWVSANDGILVRDANGNGIADGASELFGSSTQDGFAVLETFDTNGDGKIDASDAVFNTLKVWRDLDQDGVTDAGEMMTLAEAGIVSISLTRTDVAGTNSGHDVGYEALFTRADGTTGGAQTIYFQTDRQDTLADNTPSFTPAEGVDKLPQLPGSGQINSIAWKATQDASFKADWTALTDAAGTLSPEQLRAAFEDLLKRWASVDGVAEGTRDKYVDAQHLAFVEKFFGVDYKEMYAGGQLSTSPTTQQFGANIEASFNQIVDVMLTAFLAQTAGSMIARGGDLLAALDSPYFFYALLDFRHEWPAGTEPPETPGNVGMVLDLINGMMPAATGAAASYLVKAISGLDGIVSVAFEGDHAAYLTTANTVLSTIADHDLRLIAIEIAGGTAALGSEGADGMVLTEGDNVFVGGKGDDLLVSGAGSDLFVYTRGDGTDYIRDSSASPVEKDTLFLTNLSATDLTFERIGDTLILKISGSSEKIISEDFFANWGVKNFGIDQIRFADGSLMDREAIRSHTTTVGDGRNNLVQDSALNDVLQGGKGDDEIRISGGSDTILYAAGDGFDVINDTSGVKTEIDRLVLANMMPSDVELSRVGNALTIKILATGEVITDQMFFYQSGAPNQLNDWNNYGRGIDRIQFASGAVWDRQTIVKEAWIRGDDKANGLTGSALNDTFTSGHGNDTMDGGAGSDTYIWKKGDGSDYIVDNINNSADIDRLILKDVYVSDVKFSYSGDSLQISVQSTGEVISVDKFFTSADNLVEDCGLTAYGIDQITFAGGTTLNREQIFQKTGEDYLGRQRYTHSLYIDGNLQWAYFTDEFGNSGHIVGDPGYIGDNDVFSGYVDAQGNDNYNNVFHEVAGHNSVTGGSGHDFFTGGAGNDSLLGRGGDDILFGDAPLAGYGSSVTPDAAGNDYLDGGAGNDLLYGGNGNDTLIGGAGTDQLIGGDGSDTLMDSSADNDIFDGGKGDDFIQAGAYRGTVFGGGNTGSDTFIYRKGDGNDIISDSSASLTEIDRLVLSDIDSDEIELSFSGTSLVIRMLETNETIASEDFLYLNGTTGSGLDQIEFADGVIWNRSQMRSHAEVSWLRGTSSRDWLQDNAAWGQTFYGGLGDDIIVSANVRGGGASSAPNGSDTFVYGHGDGNDVIFDASGSTAEVDRLVFTDVNDNDVEISRSGNDLLIKDIVTGQTITNEGFFSGSGGQGVDAVQFANGVVWDRQALKNNVWYRGTNTNDTLQSTDIADDTFFGGLGDDYIISAFYQGNTGSDKFIYNLGDGNDVINDASRSLTEIDTLVLGGINPEDVRLSIDGYNLRIDILPSGQRIIDEAAFWARSTTGMGLDRFAFADGTVWNREDMRYWAQEGSVFFAGSTSNDSIVGSYLDQRIEGRNGNDFIDGKGGSDLIFGDAGNDTLSLSIANPGDVDAFDGGAGTDTATFENFGAAISVDLVENQGEAKTSDGPSLQVGTLRLVATLRALENVTGTAFDDEIHGDGSNNQLIGGAGNDYLDGRSGNDALLGGWGNDTLDGYLGNDTLVGGADNDTLIGGLGNDVYDYTRGDGNDAVFETQAETGSNDRIRLHNVDPSKVSFSRLGGSLVLQIAESVPGAGDAGSLTITGPQTGDVHYDQYGIEGVEFDNGTIWNGDILRQKSVSDSATDGDDVLVGTAASGIMHGGKGNDALNGAGGDDTYVYARGDGNDTITETSNNGSNDRLVFTDINPVDVNLVRNGNDVTVVIAESTPGAGDGGSVLLKNSLDDYYSQGVDKIVFADGMTWTQAAIRVMLLDQAGTAGNDTIIGFNVADTMGGKAGNDTLDGARGNDNYVYARGDGNDTITEGYEDYGDRLTFTDINASAISLLRNGNDVTIVVAESVPGGDDGGSILLKETLNDNAGRGIDQVVFADGTSWSRAQLRDILLTSTTADETLVGFSKDDAFRYGRGDGDDIIVDGTNNGNNDQLVFGDINPADVSLVRNGNDVRLVIAESAPGAGDGGSVLLKDTLANYYGQGVDKIVFADGTAWSRADMSAHVSYIGGTSGNETITGTAGSDDIRAGLGDDLLVGQAGNDSYAYMLGDGNDVINEVATGTDVDTLVLSGLDQADVRFERPFADLTDVVIRVLSTGQTIRLDNQFDQEGGVEKIHFQDGSILGGNDWSLDAVLLGLVTIYGTAGNDTIYGSTTSNDTLDSGAGNDWLAGEEGSDTYIYAAGYGHDFVNEKATGTDTDVLVLRGLNQADVSIERPSSDMTDIVIRINATGETFTLDNQFDQEDGVEKIVFADGSSLGGNDWSLDGALANLATITGTAGGETIAGTSAADKIFGGGGADTLTGGLGSDTFIFKSGFGLDKITDFTAGAGSDDVIQLADEVFADFASVLAAAAQVGTDTVITHDASNVLTLKNVALANLHQDDFQFIAA